MGGYSLKIDGVTIPTATLHPLGVMRVKLGELAPVGVGARFTLFTPCHAGDASQYYEIVYIGRQNRYLPQTPIV